MGDAEEVINETDDEDRRILQTDLSLRDDCGLFGPWSRNIGQGHLYLDRIRLDRQTHEAASAVNCGRLRSKMGQKRDAERR